MPSVVFVCVANSFRSQMAEALAKSMAGKDWDIWSAGSSPGGRLHPLAIELMREAGLSLEGHYSKGLAELPQRRWDYVVTMGCGDACPMLPAAHRLDWDLPDPATLGPEGARKIRDQLTTLVRGLVDAAA
ncbi:MAG: hypothetical protein COV75_09060 [Candidatus Omnitrophica bacterium CG11_big_fil_rev_8_21_14_0_20_63_9]|nr:MAG: hypothetical protein COV75_09060 [Candidatus Omnitrophica bacterium CG11_big_fil_rev_8_21_14_0_20_63_9]